MRALSAIHGLSLAAALVVTGTASGQPKIHPDELELKPRIDQAIDAGVEALTDTQMRNGTWGRFGNYDGGKTALCAYALLSCGVDPSQPVVRRALLYLDGVNPRQTYTVACMMLAYSAAGPAYKGKIKDLARLLLDWQREGDYGYPYPHSGDGEYSRPDLSNTQYAALGLWIAQKHRLRIPPQVFRDLAMATLQYRSAPESVTIQTSGQKGRGTSAAGGKREIRGFTYTRRGKPTGSMTTAGVGILQICKLGLGAKLGKLRRPVDAAIESGVAWLGHHFSVSRNPMGPQRWQLYYLYGLERVGSLVRIEQMGEHWWFLEGARHLLGRQNGKGMWGDEVDTAFALLFLRRATGLAGGAITGKGAGGHGGKKHLFSAGHSFDEVTIGGAGQQPLALWVPGFGEALKERHKAHGIRVVQVEYMLGDRVLGQVAGTPTKAWTTDTFLYRVPALRRGVHQIHAKVTVVAPNVRPGATEPTEAFESPKMDVEIRDVFAEWMKQAAKLSSNKNLLRGAGVEITATSNQKRARLAIDANDSTYWVCHPDDEYPELTLKMPRGVPARKLVLSQAGATGADRGQFDHILAIEIFVNGEVKPTVVNLDEDQLAVTTFDLSRRRKVKSLRVRIVSRLPGRQAFVAGFSEIALMK